MRFRVPALLLVCLVAVGCSQRLMPTPVLFTATDIDPFAGLEGGQATNGVHIFFATDRRPVDAADPSAGFTDLRSRQLMHGEATIAIGPGLGWEKLREVSLDPRRSSPGGASFAIESIATFAPAAAVGAGEHDAFTAAVAAELERSGTRDIYLFVHGYKSDFKKPLFVTAELAHYLGRDGVFIAYSWAARNAWLGYVHDRESALYSVGHFRRLLHHLADETDARRIHIVSHSTGASLVGWALRELRLLHAGLDRAALLETLRIGQVVYAAPDVDVSIFRSHFGEGFHEIPLLTTVYVNPGDNALRMVSDLMYGLTRLGDPRTTEFSRSEMEALSNSPLLDIVDADNAKGSDFTGHRYYRESPWVSSDLLLLLRTGWVPGERGLVQGDGDYAWQFPDDYEAILATIGALALERSGENADNDDDEGASAPERQLEPIGAP